jgi:hypothetical protein
MVIQVMIETINLSLEEIINKLKMGLNDGLI